MNSRVLNEEGWERPDRPAVEVLAANFAIGED